VEQHSIKSKVLSGFIWEFAERISAQLVTFIVSIILARLLSPDHYGAIAIVNVYIAIANVFVSSSFGNSLIQKKDADDKDFSSVFYFNIALGIIIYFIIYLTAPFVSSFFNMGVLCPVFRVLGLRIIVASVNSVQHAYVAKKMMFKRFFWSTLGGTLVSGVVGIIMAYRGYGIWALVAQYMTNTTVDTIVLWFTVKFRPKLMFSFKRLGGLFSYGWKLLVSALLNTGYNELRSLVIGKMYTSADLAFYNKGKSFPVLVVNNVNTSIQNVLFPAMSKEQEKKERVKAMMRRSIRTSSYIMLPLMMGLALVSEPLITFLLTKKWIASVIYLQISCFVHVLTPIQTANLQAIKALGRSDIFLKLEIIKKIMGITILIISARYGVLYIALSNIIVSVVSSVINSYPNKKLLNYSYMSQIKDVFNGIIPLLAMIVSVFYVGFINIAPLALIIIQVAVGAFVYIFVSYITHSETFEYILTTIKSFFKKR